MQFFNLFSVLLLGSKLSAEVNSQVASIHSSAFLLSKNEKNLS